jgi:hypothetical protein
MGVSYAPAVSDLYQARANLELFKNLAPGQKLEYDRQTGKFTTYTGNGFGRTMGNLFKGQNNVQSVRNDELFKVPVVETFQKLVNFVSPEELASARQGLNVLSQTYERDKNPLKLQKVNETITAVDEVIATRDAHTAAKFTVTGDLLNKYFEASNSRVQVFTKDDIGMIRDIFQNDRLARMQESRVYNDANAGGVNRMREMIYTLLTTNEGVDRITALAGTRFKNWFAALPKPAGYIMEAQDKEAHATFMARLNDLNNPPHSYTGFFHYKLNRQLEVGYRLYLCPDMLEVNKVINCLVEIFSNDNRSKLHSFKFYMDYDMEFKRRERFVVYLASSCTEEEVAAFSRQIHRRVGSVLSNEGRVLGSSEPAPNVFMLKDPGAVSLGMAEGDMNQDRLTRFNQAKQTANGLRSELLTMAYINWRSDYSFRNGGETCDFNGISDNDRKKEFFIFLRYVTTAFLAYNPQLTGINMENPGQTGNFNPQRTRNRVAVA